MEIVKIKIDELTPYEKNAKLHPKEQIEQIKLSIQKYSMCDPIGVWGEKNIICEGHGRWMALKELGYKEVDCIRLDHLTDKERKEYTIVHNKTTMDTGFDIDVLLPELEELDFLSGFDFDFGIEDKEEETEIVEDEVPEVDEDAEPIAKLGDIWQLGKHRLVCGDSTDKETVKLLMDGKKADMVMTDPPYGINAEKMTMGTGKRDFHRGKDWDCERPDISIAFDIAPLVCIWGGNYFADKLPISNDWLIWHKKNDGLSFSECEMAWTNFGVNCRHISHHWGNEKKQHITMKPLSVIAWAIERAKEKAMLIVDLFGGSGSTLIACEQLDRTCYMMELDPKYCDVILQRYINLTGTSEDVYRLNADGTKTKYSDLDIKQK